MHYSICILFLIASVRAIFRIVLHFYVFLISYLVDFEFVFDYMFLYNIIPVHKLKRLDF